MSVCTGQPVLANNITQAQAFCIATACLQVGAMKRQNLSAVSKWATLGGGSVDLLGRTAIRLGELSRQALWRKRSLFGHRQPGDQSRELKYPLFAQHRFRRSTTNRLGPVDLDDLMHDLDLSHLTLKRSSNGSEVAGNQDGGRQPPGSNESQRDNLDQRFASSVSASNAHDTVEVDQRPENGHRNLAPFYFGQSRLTNQWGQWGPLANHQPLVKHKSLARRLAELVQEANLRLQQRRQEKLASLWYWWGSRHSQF